MVTLVRLINGGTADSVNMTNGASLSPLLGEHVNMKPQAVAMYVTMNDPISRKKIMRKHQHQRVFEPALESIEPSPEAVGAIIGSAAGNISKSIIKTGTSSS